MIILSNITLSIFDHHLYNVVQWCLSLTSSCHCVNLCLHYLFDFKQWWLVNEVNEDRQAGIIKVVCKLWQGKAAAQPSFFNDASSGTNSNNNNDNYMRTPRHFLSHFLDTGLPLFACNKETKYIIDRVSVIPIYLS